MTYSVARERGGADCKKIDNRLKIIDFFAIFAGKRKFERINGKK